MSELSALAGGTLEDVGGGLLADGGVRMSMTSSRA